MLIFFIPCRFQIFPISFVSYVCVKSYYIQDLWFYVSFELPSVNLRMKRPFSGFYRMHRTGNFYFKTCWIKRNALRTVTLKSHVKRDCYHLFHLTYFSMIHTNTAMKPSIFLLRILLADVLVHNVKIDVNIFNILKHV